jgi:hypothetical protein
LIYLLSFLWHEILVLIFNMFIYMRRFVKMHCTRMRQIFIDLHPGYNCNLFIEPFTNRHVSAIKICLTTVFSFQFDYEVWEIIIYFTTCFIFWHIFVLYFHYLHRIYIELEVGPFDKLAETYFFCWRLHKYELLKFVWY